MVLQAAIAALFLAVTPVKKKVPPKPKSVVLFQVNRRESIRMRFVDDRGRPITGVQKRLDRFFRCHHSNNQGKMNPRLMRLLFAVGQHYPGRRLEVVSGYRGRTVAKNPRSPHMKGLAADFRVHGIANTELRDYLRRTFKHVGVGYYPNSSFVHLDVRKGVSAFWIDYSGPGETALYSNDPKADVLTGRIDTFKPTKNDRSWIDREGEEPADTP